LGQQEIAEGSLLAQENCPVEWTQASLRTTNMILVGWMRQRDSDQATPVSLKACSEIALRRSISQLIQKTTAVLNVLLL
jgi:hypothetical protein